MAAKQRTYPLPCLLCLLTVHVMVMLIGCSGAAASETDRKVYIVYMGGRLKDNSIVESLHLDILQRVVGSGAKDSFVRSYKRSFNGFVAKLSEEEMKKISSMKEVVSVFPNIIHQLHTTASWNFMGFPTTVGRSTVESDIIVGMLDTGLWPESNSFSDEGFGPPPSKWKGTCQGNQNFTCNNKIIGARFYHGGGVNLRSEEFNSPRDALGHGSHTSSIAAGREITGASLYGLGIGTARGAVPSSRIAVYKICWSFGCSSADILAAFDDAIADGVDIISLSLGWGSSFQLDYFRDSIAIGAFHAMKNGILTSNSAGNDGPGPSTISNYSPWSLTVAASTLDRRFVANLNLGNGKIYKGNVLNAFHLKDRMYPLVYGADVPNTAGGYNGATSRYCPVNSLDNDLVKEKIVLCDKQDDGSGPLLAGALGTIMQTNGYTDSASSFPLAATVLVPQDAKNILAYINSTSEPTANILKSEGIEDPIAPIVVSFSSRGPNPITKDILKPDLTAPGVDILAAWSPTAPLSVYAGDKRSVPYNIISGTSMSCPHVTGAAAYVKSFNPTWSPAAIKSALMTTANSMKESTNLDAEFAYGAGHINPIKAVNPGLVYDAYEEDYVQMLCGLGYSASNIQLITGDDNSCSSTTNGTVWDLNYPSFALSTASGNAFTGSFSRTVTNVGLPNSTYKGTLNAPSGLQVSLTPDLLSFKSLQEKQSFVLKVTGATTMNILSASLVWDDGVHQVRSPIVVHAT